MKRFNIEKDNSCLILETDISLEDQIVSCRPVESFYIAFLKSGYTLIENSNGNRVYARIIEVLYYDIIKDKIMPYHSVYTVGVYVWYIKAKK